MNKYLMIASFAVITTNICGMPLDGNNHKRSLNLSEISENIGNPNKKAKPNKNIIEVNENNRMEITSAFEAALRNAEDKKKRVKTVYDLTERRIFKEKDDYVQHKLNQRLQNINDTSAATSNEIQELKQVVQFIKENPSSNLEIPLTFGKAQKNVSDEKLTKIVNEAFGVNVSSKEEAESLIWEAFNAFEHYKKGSNILFWNGKAYVNGALSIFPVSDLRIKGKNYHITQLYEILGYERKVIEAMGVISNGFSLLSRAISWFSIRNFWEEAKSRKDSQIDGTLQRHKRLCRRYFHEYIKQTADYIKAARVLGINTKNLAFSSKGLSEPYNKAEEVILEFLKKFSKYIGEFNKEDQKRFIEDMNNTKNLLYEAPALLADYSQYYHTEYMVRYLQKRAERETEPIYAISYYDMCRNCEILFAKSTKEEQDEENTIVVSGYDYKMSRSQGHPHILSNKSFLQVQL